VIFRAKFRVFFQALLISAVMLAPVWGQIHKTIHGFAQQNDVGHDHDHDHDHGNDHDHDLFSDHETGSLLCLSLDHLASGEGLQSVCTTAAVAECLPLYFSFESKPVFSERLLAFAARAPPVSL
jgi:ABC-type nickel/cobalt efflux system permease component RcnA